MLNNISKTINNTRSKFIKSISITAVAILILLKPWIAKWDQGLSKELSELLKKNSDKELIIQENQNDENNFDYTANIVWWTPPDTNQIKNLFLYGDVLETEMDKKDFLKAWNESKKQPNRDPLRVTIQDTYYNIENPIKKAIFILALLDPYQKTNLGKDAFKLINSDPQWEVLRVVTCHLYVTNVENLRIHLENQRIHAENDKLDAVLKSLKEIENIYKQYIDSNK